MSIPVPYPSDTKAKGWRFELDYEKIDQSDTWGLASEVPLARPCLVMMWLVAWTQEPCGSLPNDEAIIRVRCGIPASVWPKVRELLMRGWWTADDGRLYHDTVTKRVLEMIEYRRKNAERVANFKAAKRLQQGGNALPTSDQQGKNDTGTGTGTFNSVPDGTGGAAADGKRGKTPAELRKSELWAGMKTLLVDSGESKDLKAAGAVITKTIVRYDEATALAAIEATLHARPAGAIAYLEGACQQAMGLRQNKQEVLETGNLAAAERFASEPDHATH